MDNNAVNVWVAASAVGGGVALLCGFVLLCFVCRARRQPTQGDVQVTQLRHDAVFAPLEASLNGTADAASDPSSRLSDSHSQRTSQYAPFPHKQVAEKFQESDSEKSQYHSVLSAQAQFAAHHHYEDVGSLS